MNRVPKHPPRLVPFQKYDSPLWFVTFGTRNRSPILASQSVHEQFVSFALKNAQHGIAIGKYVIMPDHIHFFIRLAPDCKLGATVGFLKKSLSAVLNPNESAAPHWQPGFFDHMLRCAPSYSEKWEYVYQNPVRAGLVANADEWPYSGQIMEIRYS
ncbi:MAG: transposase [Kiritimatiellales bacterium]|nr:transposase [Kiritimatiellales bacterium]